MIEDPEDELDRASRALRRRTNDDMVDYALPDFADASPDREIADAQGEPFEVAPVQEPVATPRRPFRVGPVLALAVVVAAVAVAAYAVWPRDEMGSRAVAPPIAIDGTWTVVDSHSTDPRAWLLTNAEVVVAGERLEVHTSGTTWVSTAQRVDEGFVVDVEGTPELLTIVSYQNGILELGSTHGSLRLRRVSGVS